MNDVPVYMVELSEYRRAGTRLEFLSMVRGLPQRRVSPYTQLLWRYEKALGNAAVDSFTRYRCLHRQ